MERTTREIEVVWRIESAGLIASLARKTGDVGLAEDLAHDALVAALEQWPKSGVPAKPGAWLMAVAKRRAIDRYRRDERLAHKVAVLGGGLEQDTGFEAGVAEAVDDDIGDDLLRLVFTACHPAISSEARVALTLRLLGGLTTEEIAHAYLVPRRQSPSGSSGPSGPWHGGDPLRDPIRRRVAREARLGARGHLRHLQRGLLGHGRRAMDPAHVVRGGAPAGTNPRHADALRARGAWTGGADGDPGLATPCPIGTRRETGPVVRPEPCPLGPAPDQPWPRRPATGRSAWTNPGPYTLQAAIAACHARAMTPEDTDWDRIAGLYDQLARLVPSPVVELNRAVAVGMAVGPQEGLELVDALTDDPRLAGYHLLFSVRGDLLNRLGRSEEARAEFSRAAQLAGNVAERELLLERARD